jgi:hypothetical protein
MLICTREFIPHAVAAKPVNRSGKTSIEGYPKVIHDKKVFVAQIIWMIIVILSILVALSTL